MMYLRVFLVLGVFFLRKTVYSAPCNCGLGSGVNICSSGGGLSSGVSSVGGVEILLGGPAGGAGGAVGDSSGGSSGGLSYPLVVRPQTLPVIDLSTLSKPRVVSTVINAVAAPTKPIGSLCSCGQTIIKPAVVPRPSCGYCGGAGGGGGNSGISGGGSLISGSSSSSQFLTQDGSSSSSSGGQTVGIITSGGPSVNFPICGLPVLPQIRSGPAYVPADAVSQQLAFQQQQSQGNNKADSYLNFGFQSRPVEVPASAKSIIAEGNFQSVNGPVLEFKPPVQQVDLDEEALEDLQQDDDGQDFAPIQPPNLINYGYGPANYPSGTFVNVDVADLPATSCGEDVVSTCRDGFQSGQVIVKQGNVPNQIPPAVPFSPPCTDEEEAGGTVFYEGPSYATYSSSSSQSSSSNNAQNVFFQKFSCS